MRKIRVYIDNSESMAGFLAVAGSNPGEDRVVGETEYVRFTRRFVDFCGRLECDGIYTAEKINPPA